MRRSGCVASTHGNREIEAWPQSVKPFFFDSLWTRLRDRDGTEDGRALNGIVYPWRSSKIECTVLRCSMR